MKKIFLVLACSLSLYSCKKKEAAAVCPEPQLNCTGINCLLYQYYFDFRLIDKTTGADLVFGSTPRYSTADIALYQDMAATIPIAMVADNSQAMFRVSLAKPEMYLVVAGTTTYKITAGFKAVDCCASRVKDLKVNGASYCTCCADRIDIRID